MAPKTDVIAELRYRVAELESDISEMRADHMTLVEDNHALRQQLLLAQADSKRLRDALENTIRHFGMKRLGESRLVDTEIRCKAHEALAQPSDTSALDAYVAEKVDYWKESCRKEYLSAIDWAGKHQIAVTDCEQLTRQRDVAVDALNWIINAIKESEVK